MKQVVTREEAARCHTDFWGRGGVKGFFADLWGNNIATACQSLQCVFICVIPLDPPKPIGEWVKCHM